MARHQHHRSTSLATLPSTVTEFMSTSTALLLIDDELITDIPMEQAFQDSVDLFDFSGPLGTILLATAAAVALLVLLKSLTNQMDAAIEKVLVDFESTLKKKYPHRWNIISAELDKLPQDERPAKLFSIMEQMQEEEPEFMSQVKGK